MTPYRILLIQPPDSHNIESPFNRVSLENKGYRCEPSLGLWCLASAIRQQLSDVEVKILDLNLEVIKFLFEGGNNPKDWPKLLVKHLEDFKPDLVGSTCLFAPTLSYVLNICEVTKNVLPNATVVVGGSQVTTLIKPFIENNNIDIAVVGEGEKVFIRLIQCLKDGTSWHNIEQIVYRDRTSGQVTRNPKEQYGKYLDEYVPFMESDLVDLKEYAQYGRVAGLTDIREPALPYETSRGCPFVCIYCAAPQIWERKLRLKSYEMIEKELESLQKKQYFTTVYLQDDVPFINRERTLKILEIFRKRGLKPYFPNSLRVNSVTEELLDAFQQTGVTRINLAIESASQKTLKNMKKNVDLEHARRIVDYARDHTNIIMTANVLFGTPGETVEDMYETIANLKPIRLDWINLGIVTPIPGSELYDIAIERGYMRGSLDTLIPIVGNMETEDYTVSQVEEVYKYANIYLNFHNNVNVREGRLDRARKDFEHVLRISPGHKEAKIALAKLEETRQEREPAVF